MGLFRHVSCNFLVFGDFPLHIFLHIGLFFFFLLLRQHSLYDFNYFITSDMCFVTQDAVHLGETSICEGFYTCQLHPGSSRCCSVHPHIANFPSIPSAYD